MSIHNIPQIIRIAVGVIVVCFLLAWSYTFKVHAVGRLQGPIVFGFYDESNKPIVKRITSFAVSERTSKGQWRPVWALDGKARIEEITYGATCVGLKEARVAEKLVPGKVYAVFASDGSGGSGGGPYFGFRRDGSMVLSKSPDALPKKRE